MSLTPRQVLDGLAGMLPIKQADLLTALSKTPPEPSWGQRALDGLAGSVGPALTNPMSRNALLGGALGAGAGMLLGLPGGYDEDGRPRRRRHLAGALLGGLGGGLLGAGLGHFQGGASTPPNDHDKSVAIAHGLNYGAASAGLPAAPASNNAASGNAALLNRPGRGLVYGLAAVPGQEAVARSSNQLKNYVQTGGKPSRISTDWWSGRPSVQVGAKDIVNVGSHQAPIYQPSPYVMKAAPGVQWGAPDQQRQLEQIFKTPAWKGRTALPIGPSPYAPFSGTGILKRLPLPLLAAALGSYGS